MTKGLAKTRSNFLREVLRDLESEILEPSSGGDARWGAGFKSGYIKALEDVFDRMKP
jgi:hypothetical protein